MLYKLILCSKYNFFNNSFDKPSKNMIDFLLYNCKIKLIYL